MKVHVTGGTGFLGSRVLPLLVARGYDVSALTRSPTAAGRLQALGARPIQGDLDRPAQVQAAFACGEPDALVNLASLGFGHAPTIVSAAMNANPRRAIFISTTAIFTSLNAASKSVRVGAERLIEDSSLDWTIIRPTMIYGGPDDRNMARLLRFLRRSPIVPLPGGGRRLQQPVHVDDLADAVVKALECPAATKKAYDAAGPTALTLRKVVEQAAHAVQRDVRMISVPLRPLTAGVRLYERLSRHPVLRAEQLERLAEDKAFDITAIRADLGFNPRPFAEGIRDEAAMIR